MNVMTIRHKTSYRYRRAVTFGPHRLMFRPRDSHDLRLVTSSMRIEPAAEVRWMHDVFSNSIAIASFRTSADRLALESHIVIENYGQVEPSFPVADFARSLPFVYEGSELPDLQAFTRTHYPDPNGRLKAWISQFTDSDGGAETWPILEAMTRQIKQEFSYVTRFEEGVLSPDQTLQNGAGSCRDFALLLMEACRRLGLAARFVTGYLYDPAIEGGETGTRGAGATHAWAQIYLPGAGWVELDPTNGIIGGTNLVRVAVARDPSQAIPVQGTYTGGPNDFEAMDVQVEVTSGRNGL